MSEEQTGVVIDSVTFRHSPMLDQIFDALSKAQGEMTGAVKDKKAQIKNEKANYSYAYSDLESVMEACRPSLNKHGICVVQPIATAGPKVTVTTLLGHKSGQWMACDLEMTSMAGSPQAVGGTITYGRRYGLQSMAGISSEDDDGAAGSTHHGDYRQASTPPPQVGRTIPASVPATKTTQATPGPFDVAKMRAAISAFEAQIGRTAFLRILGSEGFESVNEISNREAGTRVHGLMKMEADTHGVNEKDMAAV